MLCYSDWRMPAFVLLGLFLFFRPHRYARHKMLAVVTVLAWFDCDSERELC